jgi:class 3 adenylate cyclase
MGVDLDALGLDELIRLQDLVARTLQRRFEHTVALAVTDIVGSTSYFARFGDQAGRALHQRHLDLVREVLPARGGRIVDTAGDGAFSCFAGVEEAAAALIELQARITADNVERPREHQLSVRAAIHWGRVLTDGTVVSGDAVNLCHRVAATADGAELRMTRAASLQLPVERRRLCRALRPVALKGIADTVEILVLHWRDRAAFPVAVRVEETGEEIPLPDRDTLRFGRLRERDGQPLCDVVLTLPDKEHCQSISRCHFELWRRPDGVRLRPVSDQRTEVDGEIVPRDAEVVVRAGSVARLSRRMTLTFLPLAGHVGAATDETIGPGQRSDQGAG